ncbi:MAG: family lipolytic protein [Solirubrobacterales bacterium]|jgi:lysophospholipase L1-like esterase|nr:family lipolytic protein [Solirubrobacterales bacterium]
MDDHTDPLATAPWRRLVIVGDSIALGVGDPVDGYPHRGWTASIALALEAARPGLVHRNLGARGLLTEEVRETQLDAALAFRPDLAIVAAGGNDLLGPGFDGLGVEEELEEMVGALHRRGALVVTIGLFDITRSGLVPEAFRAPLSQRIRELGARTAAVVERHGGIHVDCTDHRAGADPSIYSADRRHLNAAGHAIAASLTLQALTARSGAFLVPQALPGRRAWPRWPRARAMYRTT